MPKIINTFSQQGNPMAEAIKNLGNSMFGDTLTPAIKRQGLLEKQREFAALEELGKLFGGSADGTIDPAAAAQAGILGGMKPDDLSMYSVFLAGNKRGPRDLATTNAMAGAGKYGDSAENLDLNRQNAIRLNQMDNDTQRYGYDAQAKTSRANNADDNRRAIIANEADNRQRTYEFNNKPTEALINGKPGFARQGDVVGGGGFDLRAGIEAAANRLGISPVDLATVISYETGGTFDPTQGGPTTQYGRHRGLIQFGEPQAAKYGVDWNNAAASQLGADGAIVRYLLDAGVRPGMGLMDVYSAVNAGRVGRYGASDANNGGAPGTVADKVNYQMAGHSQRAAQMFGGQAPFPQVAGGGPTYAPIPTKAEIPPLDLFKQYLQAAEAAMPNSTMEERRKWAMIQISKQQSKGIRVSPDGTIEIGGEMGDLTNANLTKVQDREMDYERFGSTLDMAIDLVAKNPNSVGMMGVARGTVQDVAAAAQGVAQLFGIQDIGGALTSAQLELAQNGISPDVLGLEYDPSVSQIESVMNILAFQGARAIGGQSGNDLSDKDIRAIKTILGDPTSLFTNQQRMLSRLDLVKKYVSTQRDMNRARLGLPPKGAAAPAPIPAPGPTPSTAQETPVAPALTGKTSRGTGWKVVQ